MVKSTEKPYWLRPDPPWAISGLSFVICRMTEPDPQAKRNILEVLDLQHKLAIPWIPRGCIVASTMAGGRYIPSPDSQYIMQQGNLVVSSSWNWRDGPLRPKTSHGKPRLTTSRQKRPQMPQRRAYPCTNFLIGIGFRKLLTI